MTTEEFDAIFKLPFNEASRFFQEKLDIPTGAWDDLWKEQHARGFMVAGAMKADLLVDLRTAVQKAIDGKLTLKDFREQFDGIVEKHGWAYKGGRNWRSRLIWDTNITTAYQAGRWQQFQEGGAEYLRYVHADGVMNPRPQHLAWNGRTLPIDHVFWKTHYPPNGWGCHCRAVRAYQDEATEEPEGWQSVNPKTGAPVGIDKGWDYNVGQAGMLSHEAVLGEKLAGMPAEFRRRAYGELTGRLTEFTDLYFRKWGEAVRENINLKSGKIKTTGETVFVHMMEPRYLEKLAEMGVAPQTAAIGITDSDWLHLQHLEQPPGSKRNIKHVLSTEQALKLPSYLKDGKAFWDRDEKRLVYVFETEKKGKVAVAVNYRIKGEKVNSIRTAKWIEAADVQPGRRYEPLD
ncbi:MAG: hypothetical protein GYA56_02355 [Geobacteraceae bacterium]|nr:hypothetical protein [Geobacteraceae bacterium]